MGWDGTCVDCQFSQPTDLVSIVAIPFNCTSFNSMQRPLHSIRVAVCLSFFHVHTEFVFLVTSHVSVTHEVQSVVVGTSGRGHEVKLHLERAGRNQGEQDTESAPACLSQNECWATGHSPWPSAAGSAS